MTSWTRSLLGTAAIGISFPALPAMAGLPPKCELEPGCKTDTKCGPETNRVELEFTCCWGVDTTQCAKVDEECTEGTPVGFCHGSS
jgi:hypothetical protein